MSDSKKERSAAMRYKRPALASLGAEAIMNELDRIIEACDDVRYYVEQADNDETLLNALNGDEDEEWEFRMAFANVSAKSEHLQSVLYDQSFDDFYQEFDDASVALLGKQYKILGFDAYEEDYYSLTSYDESLAQTEAGKRLMRKTKAEMLSTIGWCVGITLAFLDLRQSYDYLRATFDILRDENTSLLDTIKAIESAYDAAEEDEFLAWKDSTKNFNRLLDALPDRAWVE